MLTKLVASFHFLGGFMSATRLGRLFIIAFVLTLAFGVQSIAGVTGNISGHVTDDHGTPIDGAKVAVTSPSQAITTLTDTHGFYSILNLSPDTYSVTASKDGYDLSTVYGITVHTTQTAGVNFTLRLTAKMIGRVVTEATASVVSRTVTGDLYAVNASAIKSYQGSAGGSETLYSQNAVAGSLPGVVRSVGTGGGYFGNGSLSFRGGSTDQVGFELEGIPLNRGFDSANATSFVTNGLASLEVYTGGEPADAGRSMSGYINEVIQRGKYPGGADFTGVIGGPAFNHTVQADVYGATPDRRFTYFVSTLAANAGYNFTNRSNLDNTSINIPANDPGCGAFNAQILFNGSTELQDCSLAFTRNIPISQAAWQGFVNPYAAIRDTVGNFHFSIAHNGLQDDLQALYVVGGTATPFLYAGQGLDPALFFEGVGGSVNAQGQLLWPTGFPYIGQLNHPYNGAAFGQYTWPSAGGGTGVIPQQYVDGQTTESAIEKLSYTRSFSNTSFLRLYAYALYSTWNFDQATNGFLGDSYYQLHDHATGYTANYQNQISSSHLLRLDYDYTKDLTLRYNYASNFFSDGTVFCGNLSLGELNSCNPGDNVDFIGEPFAYWNDIGPINTDVALADAWRPSDRWLFDLGVRWDQFKVPLMPLQINGPNGLAEQAQNQFGACLHGFNYPVGEPCNGFLTNLQAGNNSSGANLFPVNPGATNWQDVSGSLGYNYYSPRFGMTYTLSPQQVLRFSVGRYVQPPATAYEEYRAAPFFGAGDTVSILNRFYDPLGFQAVHNVIPQDSTNYDLSFEQELGRGFSTKITPFFRNTRGQILNIPVNPAQPTFITGYNFGAARIFGSEFLLRLNQSGENGLSGQIAATYTDSKIRFERSLGGRNYIDTINLQIATYNQHYGTSYAALDPNGFYSPSLAQAPGGTTSSYDVRWVVNVNLDERIHGWDITPAFNFQSGNPYGDPQDFIDAHCLVPGGPSTPGNFAGCTPLPAGVTAPLPLGAIGPDPYTGQFDSLGSLKGPSWLTMNLGISHDLGPNVKGSFLWTNVFTHVHNQGYAWELPTSNKVLAYGDNSFYSFPLGLSGLTGVPTIQQYYGDNYNAYTPESLIPAREFVFSVSTKI